MLRRRSSWSLVGKFPVFVVQKSSFMLSNTPCSSSASGVSALLRIQLSYLRPPQARPSRVRRGECPRCGQSWRRVAFDQEVCSNEAKCIIMKQSSSKVHDFFIDVMATVAIRLFDNGYAIISNSSG